MYSSQSNPHMDRSVTMNPYGGEYSKRENPPRASAPMASAPRASVPRASAPPPNAAHNVILSDSPEKPPAYNQSRSNAGSSSSIF